MELKFDPENPKYEYITTKADADRALKLLAGEKMLAVDVESNGTNPRRDTLLLVQLGTESVSYIFDARAVNLADFDSFRSLLEDKNIIKLLQNAKFDYEFIKEKTGVRILNIYDTMLAEGVLNAGYRHLRNSLDAMAKRYLPDINLDKTAQKSFLQVTNKGKISDEQLKYAARDTLILFPIFEAQTKRLREEKLLAIAKLEFATCPVVAEMELYGVYLNTKKWREIIKNLEADMEKQMDEFQDAIRPYFNSSQTDLFGKPADLININSQVQLLDLFNNKLNLNLPSTSNGVLERVNHPVVKTLREYRKNAKLVSTYGETLLEKIDKQTGRIHPDFLQIATATGRFACNNPNMQNIPRNTERAPFRTCFNPAPGYKLVVADYSQFEMRVLADLSGDENMLKAYEEDLDLHSYTASLMFDKPYTADFKKLYPDLRQISKPIGFGLMYGMGAQGLVGRIYAETGKEISLEESEDLINRYFKSYPRVKTFLNKMSADAQKTGISITPGGRKRWYVLPEKNDPDFKRKMGSVAREGRNHPIQGTNADAIKYALVFVNERMKQDRINGGIILTVHDEIACEVREDQAEGFAPALSEEMVKAGKLFLKKVPVKSDTFVGDVWEH